MFLVLELLDLRPVPLPLSLLIRAKLRDLEEVRLGVGETHVLNHVLGLVVLVDEVLERRYWVQKTSVPTYWSELEKPIMLSY